MPSSEVMHKWKSGRLHSGGPSGPVVHSQAQAVAIKLSEEKKERANGGRYPEHSRTSPNKSKKFGRVFE